MITVALTGGIASGKSTACRMLAQKGARIIDSDILARDVVGKGKPAWREIVDHFGRDVLGPDGDIDRQLLADIVFNNPEEREFLNRITHPRIFQLMAERLKELGEESPEDQVVILDIPLLIEARAGGIFDFTLVVDATPEVQVERLITQREISAEEAWSRIRSQVAGSERLKFADLVISNQGSLEDLRLEVDRAWESILDLAGKGA